MGGDPLRFFRATFPRGTSAEARLCFTPPLSPVASSILLAKEEAAACSRGQLRWGEFKAERRQGLHRGRPLPFTRTLLTPQLVGLLS